jgi:hypothetical protein
MSLGSRYGSRIVSGITDKRRDRPGRGENFRYLKGFGIGNFASAPQGEAKFEWFCLYILVWLWY